MDMLIARYGQITYSVTIAY